MKEAIMQSLDTLVNFVLWLTFIMLCSFMIIVAIAENVRPGFIHESFHVITHSTDEVEQFKNCAAYNTKLKSDKLTYLNEIEEMKDEIFNLKQRQLVAQDHIDRFREVCGSWIFDPIRGIQKRR